MARSRHFHSGICCLNFSESKKKEPAGLIALAVYVRAYLCSVSSCILATMTSFARGGKIWIHAAYYLAVAPHRGRKSPAMMEVSRKI